MRMGGRRQWDCLGGALEQAVLAVTGTLRRAWVQAWVRGSRALAVRTARAARWTRPVVRFVVPSQNLVRDVLRGRGCFGLPVHGCVGSVDMAGSLIIETASAPYVDVPALPRGRFVLMSRPSLGVTLARAYHAFMAVLDAELRACGLAGSVRPGMGLVLYELLEEDDLRLSELSNRARVAQSTVTEVTAKMEAAGLLRRRPDPRDGRASRVRLTRKARALRPRLTELGRRLDQVYAAKLSAREIATLMRLLERLRSALAAGRPQRRRG